MRNKLLSAILSFSTLIGLIAVPVNAAYNSTTKMFDCDTKYVADNWNVEYVDTFTDAEKENAFFIVNANSADNMTGSKGALYLMSNQTGNMAKNDSTVKKEIAIQGTLSETASKDKKYRLSIDVWQGGGLMTACYMHFGNTSSGSFKEVQWATANPDSPDDSSKVSANSNGKKVGDVLMNTKYMSKGVPQAGMSWRRWGCNVTFAQPVNSIRITDNRDTSVLFDNIKLQKINSDGSLGENLIVNGDFESYSEWVEPDEPTKPDEPVVGAEKYRAQKLMCSNVGRDGQTGLALSWVNPSAETLTKVSVYDITNGEELLTDKIDTTPGKTILHKMIGLDGGAIKQYKIVFSFSDKEDVAYYANGTQSDTVLTNITDAWQVRRHNTGDAKYCPGYAYIDTTEKHSGEASVKIVSNIDREYSEVGGNIYVALQNNINLEKDKSYKISFWAKSKNVERRPQSMVSWLAFDDGSKNLDELTGTKSDWIKYEKTYTCNDASKNMLIISLDSKCDGLWFDDFECYEIDESGKVVGNNILVDGGFEEIASECTASVNGISATTNVYDAELSWSLIPGDSENVNIYQKVDDEYEYRGQLGKGLSSLKITGLASDTEYTYKLVPENGNKLEGSGEEITFKTKTIDYEVFETKLKKGSTTVEALDGEGKYTAVTRVKNNLVSDNGGVSAEQLVAIYDAEGVLVKLYSTSEKVEVNNYKDVSTEFILDKGTYTVEVFVIDSRTTLNKLKDYSLFN